MLTVGLIDNSVIVRLGIALLLEGHFKKLEKILEADTLLECIEIYKGQTPDLIILGNNFLSRQGCLQVVRQVKKEFPNVPLVVYDELMKQNMAVSYFEAGVNGYLLKRSIPTELINCVDAVFAKKHFLCPLLLEKFFRYMVKQDSDASGSVHLTNRESEIATYLTQGMRTTVIANHLGLKPSTISTIKNNIFKKLNVDNVVQLMKMIPQDY